MQTAQHNEKISCLGRPDIIWAVPAIHGDLDQLITLHDRVFTSFQVGDRLVYLGNYTGYGDQSAACIDEILTFRRLLLSLPGMLCDDIVYLRGAQEEMWQKLLELPFAPNPTDTFLWMLGKGLSGTLRSYGLCEHDGMEACRNGVRGLTKWTAKIREHIRMHAGHETFNTALKRAAHSALDGEHPILFVNTGLDTNLPLDQQDDQFWWAGSNFEQIENPYLPFQKVVRGFDPKHKGLHVNCVTATLDDGCGFGGQLVCGGFDNSGQLLKLIEA